MNCCKPVRFGLLPFFVINFHADVELLLAALAALMPS